MYTDFFVIQIIICVKYILFLINIDKILNRKKSDQKIKALPTLVSDFLKFFKCFYSTSKQQSFFFFPNPCFIKFDLINSTNILQIYKKNEIKCAYESISVRILFNFMNVFLYLIFFIT